MTRMPKPPDRERSPRFKHAKAKPPAIKEILDAVSALTRVRATSDHYAQYKKETESLKNHRGMALLLTAQVENMLKRAIVRNLNIDTDLEKELFGTMKPLGSFAAKIRAAQAVRVIGPETRTNLDVIRTIRNAFAHAMIPLSFETPQIAKACAALAIPMELFGSLVPPSPQTEKLIGRKRFKHVCETISSNLLSHTFAGPVKYNPSAMEHPVEANYEVWARQAPLP